MSKPKAHGKGPPRKAPNGLTAILYVRCEHELIADIDAAVARRNESNEGPAWSRADLARALLKWALRADGRDVE